MAHHHRAHSLEPLSMTQTELRAIGEALYGKQWQTQLARALTISPRHVRAMVAGERAITKRTEAQIMALVSKRQRVR